MMHGEVTSLASAEQPLLHSQNTAAGLHLHFLVVGVKNDYYNWSYREILQAEV